MLANRTNRWSIGAALLCIVLLTASWFLLISPRRADALDVRGQAAQADSQAAMLQAQIASLKVQFADLPKQKAELKAIKAQLPPGGDVPGFVRDLQTVATQTGVSLDSIIPSTPTVIAPAGAAAPTTSGAGSLVGVPVSIVVTGEYFEVTLFVKYLQTKIARSYLITGLAAAPAPEVVATPTATPVPTATATAAPTAAVVTAAPAPNLDRVTLSLTGSVFVLLDGTVTLDDVTREAKAAAAAGAAKTSSGTPAPTSTAAAN
jgi:Tfp pilus assembly protein PilO